MISAASGEMKGALHDIRKVIGQRGYDDAHDKTDLLKRG
jgi:hypothetical protein